MRAWLSFGPDPKGKEDIDDMFTKKNVAGLLMVLINTALMHYVKLLLPSASGVELLIVIMSLVAAQLLVAKQLAR
jgi:hypothetical protein